MLEQIIGEWHASIGKAILENWEFPESMAQAVGEQEELARTEPEPPDLSDVIARRDPDGAHTARVGRLVRSARTACRRARASA